MSKGVGIILLCLCFANLASSQGSLLEMSQQLWSKLLTGGFAKTGKLDPLRVPVIKVDQSEGDTSYRIILRNVEISGLNDSTLESIHIARGRLKSNLSELEAGYVSYSDLRDLDSIRYRFHTLIKEPKTQNESFEAIVSATNQESKFRASSREQEGSFERLRQYDPFLLKIQADQMKESSEDRRQAEGRTEKSSNYGTFSMKGARVVSKPDEGRVTVNSRYPSDVQLVYAMGAMNSGLNSRNNERKEADRSGSSTYFGGSQASGGEAERRESFADGGTDGRYEDAQGQRKDNFGGRRTEGRYEEAEGQRRDSFDSRRTEGRYEDAEGQRRSSFDSRRTEGRYEDVRGQGKDNFSGRRAEGRYEDVEGQRKDTFGGRRTEERYEDVQGQRREYFSDGRVDRPYKDFQGQRRDDFGGRRAEGFSEDAQTSASENVESKVSSQEPRIVPAFAARDRAYQDESRHLEKRPGYIDILYADGNNNGSLKRFGNGKIDSTENARVYGVKDIQKDILENRRPISGNCTDGESLAKRNDAIKAAIAANSLKNLTRYANDYQERQGYFEEGMQLVYHYGGMGSKNSGDNRGAQGARHKRAHKENETDDDVMHVILKIRVPLLRIKADYQLMGKVGKELVRGSGRLDGTFSELLGDFTIELKKMKDQDVLIVRAARSKLLAKSQNVDLQGMDEKGPVKSILNHGLMAAEAVAAMLADDLATKALNDRTADAMIYKMYKNLPVN
ncbi:uncharacterized protein LOC143376505 [Andrena cerasifolii]|uniref:uncharacterized protein LOC143376505 n=1 Tax=Andrena cerasifolii TaxID=2819439 RepID=UPI00403818F4